MKRIYLGSLLMVAVIFVIYGIVVLFAEIDIPTFTSAVISIFSLIISLMILIFSAWKKVTSKFYKGLIIFMIPIMVAICVRLIYLIYTGTLDKELDLVLLSNYATIAAFGLTLASYVLDKTTTSKSQNYVSMTSDNKVILKREKF
ncbi:hypothetical protein IFU39_19045 [Paenibacillus sp. CFBP 13594]|uniref:hypothetical protein n=1 Tax=Paenibacillus sp. CFBP 13594 TaxID=2774037 RepID=UPI00178135B4|nr:hypothetical protein [Paenibacillus sp. CFBP 13594]MBD8839914.1 hypothetical protein [Paenibacillus sp. CFBP 13594]